MIRTRCRSFLCMTACIGGLAMLAVVETSHAQEGRQRSAGPGAAQARPGQGGFGNANWFQDIRQLTAFTDLLQPDFHMRDLAIMAQQLEIDQRQRPIIELLIQDYRDAFTEAARELEQAAQQAPPLRMAPNRGGGPMAFGGRGGGQREIVINGEDGPVVLRIGGEDDGESSNIGIAIARPNADAGSAEVEFRTDVIVMNEDGIVISDDLPDDVRERVERINERIQQRRQRVQERMEQCERRRAEQEANALDPSEILAIAREFQRRKQSLREQFVDDVHIMLSPWQQEQWPKVQQTLRRINLLSQSRLSGEQVDLTRILRDLWPVTPNERAVEPIVDQYIQSLDAALAERSAMLEQASIDRFEARHAEDWDRLIDLATREADLRLTVRSINEQFADQIAEHLPENDRDRFLLTFAERAFPQLSNATQASRFFRRAFELDSLEPEQHEAVEQIQREHDRELLALNQRHRDTLREREPQWPREMLEMIRQMHSGEMEEFRPPAMVEFENMRERMTFARPYLDQMRGIISEDEMPELHQRDQRRQWEQMGERFRQRGAQGEIRRGPRRESAE